MSKPAGIPLTRLIIAILLMVALLLTVVGLTDRFLGTCGLDRLASKNEAYLESAFQRSLRTFAVLSTIKVGLAVVEGSEIGVGFGLQVGDVVQAAYDYVDIAWRTVLAGGILLLGTRILLEAAALLAPWLLAVTFAAFALIIVTQGTPPRLPRAHRTLRQVAVFMTVLTTACCLLLPLSIAGGAWLSSRITAPSAEEAESGLSGLKEDLFVEDQTTDAGLTAKWTQMKDRLDHTASYLKEKASVLVVWILKLIAAYLFDCLVFPLVLFVLLVWCAKVIAGGLFEQAGRTD